MNKNPPSLFALIGEATQMLNDRPKVEQDLIYSICTLTDEERSAICFAYKALHEKDE